MADHRDLVCETLVAQSAAVEDQAVGAISAGTGFRLGMMVALGLLHDKDRALARAQATIRSLRDELRRYTAAQATR